MGEKKGKFTQKYGVWWTSNVFFNVLLNSCISQTIVNKRGFGGRSWQDVGIFRGEKLLMAGMEDEREEIRG